MIERELPRARALLDEASEIARSNGVKLADMDLGMGALEHFEGDLAPARTDLERAIQLARAAGDSWRESIGTTRLAMLAVESGDWEEVRRRASELRAVAAKFGEGIEGASADALDALALHAAGDPAGRERVEASLDALTAADAKAMLAFVATVAAETELRTPRPNRAREWAQKALDAAKPIGRPSAIVLARVMLARAELADGARDAAKAHHDAAASLLGDPYAMSKRARDALAQLAVDSNGSTNAGAVAPALKKRKR